jgi:capsular exopolysaccharide synthesis family protein
MALTFLGGSFGFLISLATPKQYKAESQIFISTPTPSIDIGALQQGSNFAQQRVISYARVLSGPATLVPVIKTLGLQMNSSELAGKIKSSAPLGTVLINITVTDNTGVRAAAIANAVAIQFGETIKTLELPQFGDNAGVKATMVRSAEIPGGPSTPNTKLNLLTGMLTGFIIACLIGIVRQIFDSSVKNVNHLSGRPLLSTIFFDPEAEESPLLTNIGNYSIRAESFRHLRTALKFPTDQNNCEVIAVTSAFPGEGKTTTSINLAIAYAQIGLKVALVEADLRRPSFKKYFTSDSDHAIGLMEVLDRIESGKAPKKYESFFQSFGNEDECFEWIASGAIPNNPAEKLDSAASSVFISGLKREYDIVIVDTPPALPVTDAAVLSAKVDSVIVVARAGVTKQSHLLGVFELLDNLRAKTLGVVLNMVPQHARGEEYGYAYNRYEPKSKYGYSYGYGYGTTEPYGPLVLQSNLPATGQMRVPLEVRIKAKLANRKKVRASKAVGDSSPQSNLPATSQMRVPVEVRIKAKLANRKKVRASKAVGGASPEVKSSEFEKLLAEIEKKYS